MKLSPVRNAPPATRHGNALDMNLVSLIDVFTILIFFLLSNSGVRRCRGLRAPAESTAKLDPKETLVVVVNANEITVDGRKVADVAPLAAAKDDLIPGLKAEPRPRLVEARRASRERPPRRTR